MMHSAYMIHSENIGRTTGSIYSINQLINQSIKIYVAPLLDQDPYSEVLPTQAKRKSTVLIDYPLYWS